jgi:hypothetical protein
MVRFAGIVLAAVILACLPAAALADGKFYAPPAESPPLLPYQRALIAHDGARELLILQSKFDGEARDFGWVVPVPSVPEMASMNPDKCQSLFERLAGETLPSEQSAYKNLLYLVFLVSAFLVVCAVARRASRRAHAEGRSSFFSPFKITVIAVLLMVSMIIVGSVTGRGCGLLRPFFTHFGIGVVSEESVGVYDVAVIDAQDGAELAGWLRVSGYAFTSEDEKVFDEYVRRGWYFVTARINLARAEEQAYKGSRGMLAPLVLLFECRRIVYPLALTGSAGEDTMVKLYIFHSHQAEDPSGRFDLDFAGQLDLRAFEGLLDFDPESFKTRWDLSQTYLTKLTAILTPDQMKEDLQLDVASSDKPYRRQIWHW